MILETKFNVLQRVTIIELDAPATIQEIRFNGLSIIYCLEYWNNGEIRCVNLFESELAIWQTKQQSTKK